MEKLKERLDSCQRAVATLDEALNMPFSIIVRDGSIQRFEFSFEALWKLLKAYLEQHEGIVCNSPKSCFREALQIGLLSAADTQTCLAMTDDRNLTAHTYIEALAKRIYRRLPAYLTVMQSLMAQIQARV
ncbi:MAG: nucleotidyltransferase [Chloroflexi bacterium HGW-Chloroflexi-1]|nr:MAG: nucleotidyltransferase [Chloroflexi bacterium HGW-Chloroflexi-1]